MKLRVKRVHQNYRTLFDQWQPQTTKKQTEKLKSKPEAHHLHMKNMLFKLNQTIPDSSAVGLIF